MNSMSRRVPPRRGQTDRALSLFLEARFSMMSRTALTFLLVISKVRRWLTTGAGQLVSLVSAGEGLASFLPKQGELEWQEPSYLLCTPLFLGKTCDACFIAKRIKTLNLSLTSLNKLLHFSEPCVFSLRDNSKPPSQSNSKDQLNGCVRRHLGQGCLQAVPGGWGWGFGAPDSNPGTSQRSFRVVL